MAGPRRERASDAAVQWRSHAHRLVRPGNRPGGEILQPPDRRRSAADRRQLRPRPRLVPAEMKTHLLATLLAPLLLAAPAHAQTPANAEEIAFWETVRDSRNPAELQAYI